MKLNIERILIDGFLIFAMLTSLPFSLGLQPETVRRRDLVIDLGDGLTTDAQLTLPAVGEGPFPGILLIPGGGAPDMDEYMPPEATETGEPARPHLQMAEYLSERGFVVLRYNKRGVGLKGTLSDPDVFFNTTIQDLKRDAEKALEVLMHQPEVDADDITLLGHSESTIIAPLIAIENPSVKNIVLMGAAARSFSEIRYSKIVDLRIHLAEDVLDTDNDGLISIRELLDGLGPSPRAGISANDLVENSTGEWLWRPPWDANRDGYVSISGEFQPLLIRLFDYMISATYPGSKLVQSHLALNATLDLIGKVPSSILILEGENDILVPLEEALLLEQRLTEAAHPDHTLITYPGLGHYFYPEDYWSIKLGPIQDYVLSDLVSWLKNPARKVHRLSTQISNLIAELDLRTNELESARTNISDLEIQVKGFQSTLGTSTTLTNAAIVISMIAVAVAFVMRSKARVIEKKE